MDCGFLTTTAPDQPAVCAGTREAPLHLGRTLTRQAFCCFGELNQVELLGISTVFRYLNVPDGFRGESRPAKRRSTCIGNASLRRKRQAWLAPCGQNGDISSRELNANTTCWATGCPHNAQFQYNKKAGESSRSFTHVKLRTARLTG